MFHDLHSGRPNVTFDGTKGEASEIGFGRLYGKRQVHKLH